MALSGHMRRMKVVAAFGGSEDAGGDARAPSLGPRLRGDDGWWMGMTGLVYPGRSGGYFQRKSAKLRYTRVAAM